MANHYIRQDIERKLILLGLTPYELVTFINIAITEKLDRKAVEPEEGMKTK